MLRVVSLALRRTRLQTVCGTRHFAEKQGFFTKEEVGKGQFHWADLRKEQTDFQSKREKNVLQTTRGATRFNFPGEWTPPDDARFFYHKKKDVNVDWDAVDMAKLNSQMKDFENGFWNQSDVVDLIPHPWYTEEFFRMEREHLNKPRGRKDDDAVENVDKLMDMHFVRQLEFGTGRFRGKRTATAKIEKSWALFVMGNERGVAGYGIGKGANLPKAKSRAKRECWKNLIYVPRVEGRTILEKVVGKHGKTKVIIEPRPRLFGMTCNKWMAFLMDCFGIRDVHVRVIGRRKNRRSEVIAVWHALSKVKSPRQIAVEQGKNLYRDFEPSSMKFEYPDSQTVAEKTERINLILQRIEDKKAMKGKALDLQTQKGMNARMYASNEPDLVWDRIVPKPLRRGVHAVHAGGSALGPKAVPSFADHKTTEKMVDGH